MALGVAGGVVAGVNIVGELATWMTAAKSGTAVAVVASPVPAPVAEEASAELPAAAPEPAPQPAPEPAPEPALAEAPRVPAVPEALESCAECHTFAEGAGHAAGPNLAGVVGAPMARWEDYDYSPVLAALSGVWSEDVLDAFLADPGGYLPGTASSFSGIADAQHRARIIATLKDLPVTTPAGR